MLLRSGVQHIRLIDFDQVTLSSLNRHAVATRADVGLAKVEAMKRRLLDILPQANIESCNTLFDKDSASDLLSGNPDFVLDCIDNVNTKVDLLEACVVRGIKVLSSMGSGAKADPTRIQIADISETFGMSYVLTRSMQVC
jgi:tRNA A37 threonylcarbamoyladenosine dehydratase